MLVRLDKEYVEQARDEPWERYYARELRYYARELVGHFHEG